MYTVFRRSLEEPGDSKMLWMWNEFSTVPIFDLQTCNAHQKILRAYWLHIWNKKGLFWGQKKFFTIFVWLDPPAPGKIGLKPKISSVMPLWPSNIQIHQIVSRILKLRSYNFFPWNFFFYYSYVHTILMKMIAFYFWIKNSQIRSFKFRKTMW